MDRISVQVFIENASDAVLQLSSSNLDHGDWTNDVGPPASIGPNEANGFESEGHLAAGVPITGTEGEAHYTIKAPGNVGELYIHWDSPLIESQYGNTYHVWCPSDWEIGYTGGQGHNAELHVRLRRTAIRRVPNFDPRVRGFAFSNSWSSDLPATTLGFVLKTLYSNEACIGEAASKVAQSVITSTTAGIAPIAVSFMSDDWGPRLTSASSGLCGGMTYATMDYYNAHLLPPETTSAPSSADDPLFQFIEQRQMDSFDFQGDGCRFLVYSLGAYPNGDEGFVQTIGLWRGRSWVTYREAWPQIQADIDAGNLSPIGLIHSDSNDLSNNHQVLAYGYKRSGQEVTLYILDPNHPQQAATYTFNITDTAGEVNITQVPPFNDSRIYCLFRINNYSGQTPPGGRRFNSIKQALTVVTGQPSGSVRSSTGGQRSVLAWLRAL